MSEIDEVMVATLQEATFGDGYNKMVSMLADKLVEHYGITRSTAVNCAKSKSTLMILGLVTPTNTLLSNDFCIKYIMEAYSNAQSVTRELNSWRRDMELEKIQAQRKVDETKKELEELRKRVEALQAKLSEFETPEMRDRVRAYEILKDDVQDKAPTLFYNGQFVKMASAILAGAPNDEMK